MQQSFWAAIKLVETQVSSVTKPAGILRAVDPHSFFVDPDPAVLLNADPDPAA